MYRIGKVSDIKSSDRLVRVRFEDVGIVSGWLKVINSPPFVPTKRGETGVEEKSDGSGKADFEEYSKKVILSSWFPAVGDSVVCLYNDGFNEDGIVIGGL